MPHHVIFTLQFEKEILEKKNSKKSGNSPILFVFMYEQQPFPLRKNLKINTNRYKFM